MSLGRITEANDDSQRWQLRGSRDAGHVGRESWHLDREKNAALVVADAAAPERAVLQDRRKGGRGPGIQRVGRLYIVVPVYQHRWRVLGTRRRSSVHSWCWPAVQRRHVLDSIPQCSFILATTLYFSSAFSLCPVTQTAGVLQCAERCCQFMPHSCFPPDSRNAGEETTNELTKKTILRYAEVWQDRQR